MKYKLLIGGDNSSMMRDFFMSPHDQFMCMSTSQYWEDISKHFILYEPHALIWLMDYRDSQQIALLKKIKSTRTFSGTPIIIITDDETNIYLESLHLDCIDMTLCRPLTISSIYLRIFQFLDQREKEKERRLAEEKALLNEIAAKAAQQNTIKHVLVIDDDRNILKLLKAALEEKYHVTTMISGKMAERYLETKSCDVILLDYQMPGENGPEVFQKIKQIESAKDIPIVFLTGVADSDKIAEVLMLKPQGYLLKPIDTERLLETIDHLVNPANP